MAISRERLKELIKENAVIYSVDNYGFNEHKLYKNIYKIMNDFLARFDFIY